MVPRLSQMRHADRLAVGVSVQSSSDQSAGTASRASASTPAVASPMPGTRNLVQARSSFTSDSSAEQDRTASPAYSPWGLQDARTVHLQSEAAQQHVPADPQQRESALDALEATLSVYTSGAGASQRPVSDRPGDSLQWGAADHTTCKPDQTAGNRPEPAEHSSGHGTAGAWQALMGTVGRQATTDVLRDTSGAAAKLETVRAWDLHAGRKQRGDDTLMGHCPTSGDQAAFPPEQYRTYTINSAAVEQAGQAAGSGLLPDVWEAYSKEAGNASRAAAGPPRQPCDLQSTGTAAHSQQGSTHERSDGAAAPVAGTHVAGATAAQGARLTSGSSALAQQSSALALSELSLQLRNLLSTEERIATRAMELRHVVPAMSPARVPELDGEAGNRQAAGVADIECVLAGAAGTCRTRAPASTPSTQRVRPAQAVLDQDALGSGVAGGRSREVTRLLQELTDSLARDCAAPVASASSAGPEHVLATNAQESQTAASAASGSASQGAPVWYATNNAVTANVGRACRSTISSDDGEQSDVINAFLQPSSEQLRVLQRALAEPTVASSEVSCLPGLTGLPSPQRTAACTASNAGASMSAEQPLASERTLQEIERVAVRFLASPALPARAALSVENQTSGQLDARFRDGSRDWRHEGLPVHAEAGTPEGLGMAQQFLMAHGAGSVAESAPLSEGEVTRLMHSVEHEGQSQVW
jgi:hypothetical protein